MEAILFGAFSTVGAAIMNGLFRKYEDLSQTRFARSEIQDGIDRLKGIQDRPLIVVISIGVLEPDNHAGARGLLRQFNLNTSLPSQILEAAVSNPMVREVHIASSVAALSPRPGFSGYHISKRALDELARAVAFAPPGDVSIFLWRLPFIASPLNLGRKPPPIFRATAEELADRVASEHRPGVLYIRKSHKILARPLIILGLVWQAFVAR